MKVVVPYLRSPESTDSRYERTRNGCGYPITRLETRKAHRTALLVVELASR